MQDQVKTDRPASCVPMTPIPSPSLNEQAATREAGKTPLIVRDLRTSFKVAGRQVDGGPGWTRTTDLPLIRRTL